MNDKNPENIDNNDKNKADFCELRSRFVSMI